MTLLALKKDWGLPSKSEYAAPPIPGQSRAGRGRPASAGPQPVGRPAPVQPRRAAGTARALASEGRACTTQSPRRRGRTKRAAPANFLSWAMADMTGPRAGDFRRTGRPRDSRRRIMRAIWAPPPGRSRPSARARSAAQARPKAKASP